MYQVINPNDGRRATLAFGNPWSTAIRLRGDWGANYNVTNLLTFEVTVAAGGNSAAFVITSGNASDFEYIRFYVKGANGVSVNGTYAGGTTTVNTTNIYKMFDPDRPEIIIGVDVKLKKNLAASDSQVDSSYSFGVSTGTFVAGFVLDTVEYLNTTNRGQIISATASYNGGTTTTTVVVTSLASVGLDVEAFLDGVSIATGTIAANGTVTLTDVAVVAAGTHEVKVVITSAGAAKDSYVVTSFTV